MMNKLYTNIQVLAFIEPFSQIKDRYLHVVNLTIHVIECTLLPRLFW